MTEEKRQDKRIAVEEAFSIFMMIQSKQGQSKIEVKNISKGGICFAPADATQFSIDEEFELYLYTTPKFYFPMSAVVRRVEAKEIAIEFLDKNAKAVKSVEALLHYFDLAADVAVF